MPTGWGGPAGTDWGKTGLVLLPPPEPQQAHAHQPGAQEQDAARDGDRRRRGVRNQNRFTNRVSIRPIGRPGSIPGSYRAPLFGVETAVSRGPETVEVDGIDIDSFSISICI